MTRDVLKAILAAAEGIEEKAGAFVVRAEHRASFYLGNDGRDMVVSEVERVRFEPSFVAITGRDLATTFAPYEAVFAISVKPPRDNTKSRAGFA